MKSLTAQLSENRFLRTQHEITEFRNALNALKAQSGSQNLGDMFRLFEDSAKHSPSLEILLDFLFSFDYREVVSAITQTTPSLISKAPIWLRVIYIRVLANENSKEYLKDILPTLSDERRLAIYRVLDELSKVDYDDEQVNSDLRQDIEFVTGK